LCLNKDALRVLQLLQFFRYAIDISTLLKACQKQFIEIEKTSMLFWRYLNHKAEGHPTMTSLIGKLSTLLEAGSGDARKGLYVNLGTSKGVSFSMTA
jgi:hypothetical protein